MVEIKRRTKVIDHYNHEGGHVLYRATTVETIYLQLRKIVELIVFGTLITNKEIYAKQYKKFATTWNVKYLLQDIERLNPDFYPVPVNQKEVDDPKIFRSLEKIESGYLKKKELLNLYEMCGKIMHSENPFGVKIDYDQYFYQVKNYRNKIVCLLNAHEIRFYKSKGFYLIQMGNNESDPTYVPFEPVESKKNN